jgi:hypothetical protein
MGCDLRKLAVPSRADLLWSRSRPSGGAVVLCDLHLLSAGRRPYLEGSEGRSAIGGNGGRSRGAVARATRLQYQCDWRTLTATPRMSGHELKSADAPDECSAPLAPVSKPSPPAQLAASVSPGRDWLGSIAHFALIASVATYGAGFIIAVPHYLRRTVPVRALTHDVYLDAGIYFGS